MPGLRPASIGRPDNGNLSATLPARCQAMALLHFPRPPGRTWVECGTSLRLADRFRRRPSRAAHANLHPAARYAICPRVTVCNFRGAKGRDSGRCAPRSKWRVSINGQGNLHAKPEPPCRCATARRPLLLTSSPLVSTLSECLIKFTFLSDTSLLFNHIFLCTQLLLILQCKKINTYATHQFQTFTIINNPR